MGATRTVASRLDDQTVIVERLTTLLDESSDDEWLTGTYWYAKAHAEALAIAEETGVPLAKVVGVIAALSPKLSWAKNVAYAAMLIEHGTAPVLPRSLNNARRIMAGEHPASVLSGRKTSCFYQCIMTPGVGDQVTVDQHAFDAALGVRGSDTHWLDRAGVYELIAGCYRLAGAHFGISPAQAQAIVWVRWRSLKRVR